MRFFLLIFLLNTIVGFSQNHDFEYLPRNKDSVFAYVNAVNQKKITKFGDNHRKKIKENILERQATFIQKINDSSFVFNQKIAAYVNSILKEIYNSNPQIDSKDFYFFIDKSQIPNAACYGNGVFTINLGLFNFVNSDDEMAFIICHEIAHYLLEHNDKSLVKYLETMNEKEVKSKIRSVKNQKYGKRKAYTELMDELSYNFLKRNQKVEIEADSLGFMLYRNTKFSPKASVTSLENLGKSDDIIFNEDSKIKENFNFKDYPFKDNWIQKDETLFDLDKSSNDFISNVDSISTHPSIPLRIQKLNILINDRNSSVLPEVNQLESVKETVSFISIKNFIDSNQIDLAFYQCLVMYNLKKIDKETYVDIISKLLKKTYELKEKHVFGKYVSPIYPFSDELYLNEVKQFLNNIELKNIRKIGLHFCLANEEIMKKDKDFMITLQYFKSLNP